MATNPDTAVDADASDALNRLSEGFLAVDAELRVTQINAAAAALLGGEQPQSPDHPREAGGPVGARLGDIAGERLATACRQAAADAEELTVAVAPDDSWLRATIYPGADGLSILLRDPDTEFETALLDGGSVLEQLHETASDPELDRETKIRRMLALGRDRLETATGMLTRVEGDTHRIITATGPTAPTPGTESPLSETHCRRPVARGEPVTIDDASAPDRADDPAVDRFEAKQYLGAPITVDDRTYGTVCFVDPEPRDQPATEREVVFLEVLTSWVQHLLEERAYERELDQQRAVTGSILDSLPDPLYVLDTTGELTRWNNQFEAVTGQDGDALADSGLAGLTADTDRTAVEGAVDAALDGQSHSIAVRFAGDEQRPHELSHAPLRDDDGRIVGAVGVGRDVSDQRRQNERLSGMLESTRSLMQARTREEVAEIAVGAAREVLGFEINVFRLYDRENETLEPAAATDQAQTALGERPVYDIGEGLPGTVFASGEPRVVGSDEPPAPVESGMYYPVGVHGTISVCSTDPDAFDRTDEQVLALLATSAAAACTRAKREAELRDAREHTGRVLSRVNGLVQNTVEVLVEATTRAEIETGVVDELAAADPYALACVFRPDITDDQLVPSARAGATELSPDELSLGDDDPVARAHREGTAQIRDLDATTTGPWADAARTMEALVAIPLEYKQAEYGVLVVFARDGDDLDGRERAVLEPLGRAVGNAVNAVERGRVLDATEIIELEIAVDDDELLFNKLSVATDCLIEAVEIDSRADGQLRTYMRATGDQASCETLLEHARDAAGVVTAEAIVNTDDGCLLELVVTGSLLGMVAEHGAMPRTAVAEDGTTRVTVELAYEAEARELFDLVEAQHPGAELLEYHERERPVETRQDFTAALADQFTDRQETALRTAYHGGFFDWPRDVDGNELAEAMAISRPTYHQHLRAAQQKVFRQLFESAPPSR